MTPDQLETAARQQYNAINDTFWSSEEIRNYIYGACLEVSDEAYAVERVYTTPTVASTQGYDFPENAIGIKRVTYDGMKLRPIDMREDDLATGFSAATTSTGTPTFYFVWNKTIYLRPIPAAVATLKIYTYNQQGAIQTGSTTIEIPSQHHMRLVNSVLQKMSAKDSNFEAARWYQDQWSLDKIEIRKSMRKLKRADGFTGAKAEEPIIDVRF